MKLISKKSIIITTGDTDGVGLEVTAKALARCKRALSQFNICVVHNSLPSDMYLKSLNKNFNTEKISAFDELLKDHRKNKDLFMMRDSRNPANWVEDAARFCLQNSSEVGIVTGPLSKQTIWESGLKDIGHTGILKRISGQQKVHMGFLGRKFNVVLATDHIPIGEVKKFIRRPQLIAALQNSIKLAGLLSPRNQQLPIGVLGLNPHSGDGGLIGAEESQYIIPAIGHFNASLSKTIGAEGPLVPDAAFLPDNHKKFSLYLAMYHDQGLIPFKSFHGQSGTHITLGIPFIRTSVDHGTAKDIFHKNKANFKSMYDSIQFCMTLLKRHGTD